MSLLVYGFVGTEKYKIFDFCHFSWIFLILVYGARKKNEIEDFCFFGIDRFIVYGFYRIDVSVFLLKNGDFLREKLITIHCYSLINFPL